MPTANDFLTAPPRYIVTLIGPPKSGKSDALMTFPAVYPLTCDPVGLEFLKTTDRGRLLGANLAAYPVELDAVNLDAVFKETKEPDTSSIWGWINHARQLAKAGEIKTVGLDGASYLSIWLRAWQETLPENRTNAGELNTLRMWGNIKLWWSRFFLKELMPLCSRYHLNVIMTCHVQRESEEVVSGGTIMGRKIRAKVQTDSDIAPAIEGSFRDLLGGLPGAVIYLDHQAGEVRVRDAEGAPMMKDGKPMTAPGVVRIAYCDKVKGLDTVVPAGNRYGLPAKINLTDRSLYQLLLKYSGRDGSKPTKSTNEPNSIQDQEKEQTA